MGGTSADYGAVQQTGQNRRPRLTAAPAEKGWGRCRRRHLPLPRVPEPAKYEAPGSRRRECACRAIPGRDTGNTEAVSRHGTRRSFSRSKAKEPRSGRPRRHVFLPREESPRPPAPKGTPCPERTPTAGPTKKSRPEGVGPAPFPADRGERKATAC